METKAKVKLEPAIKIRVWRANAQKWEEIKQEVK